MPRSAGLPLASSNRRNSDCGARHMVHMYPGRGAKACVPDEYPKSKTATQGPGMPRGLQRSRTNGRISLLGTQTRAKSEPLLEDRVSASRKSAATRRVKL